MLAPQIPLLALALLAPPADPPATPDYELGLIAGKLIGARSVGVVGEITSVGQTKADAEVKELRLQPFQFKVESTVWGKSPAAGETIEFTAATYPPSRVVDELWRVWNGVPVVKGTKLLIFRFPDDHKTEFRGIPRTVAHIFVDPRDLDRLGRVKGWNERHEGSLRRLAAAVVALDGRVDFSDPLYAGYVVGRLLGQEPLTKDERSGVAQARVLLIDQDRIRQIDRKDIIMQLGRDYEQVTGATRDAVVKAFIRTASGEGEVAEFAIYLLSGICKTDRLDLKPLLTADLKTKLRTTYKAAVAPRPGGFKGYPEVPELATQLEGN